MFCFTSQLGELAVAQDAAIEERRLDLFCLDQLGRHHLRRGFAARMLSGRQPDYGIARHF